MPTFSYYDIKSWNSSEPNSNWYKEYMFADDIWKVPVGVPDEVVKAWREAYYLHQKICQQPEYIGEI